MAAAPVFDSFALLAFLRDEPGAEQVSRLLERAGRRNQPVHMTEVNYAEVQYIIRRKDGDEAWAAVARELKLAPIQFHPVTRTLADLAADFKVRFQLSLTDAFAAALAKLKKTNWSPATPSSRHCKKRSKLTG